MSPPRHSSETPPDPKPGDDPADAVRVLTEQHGGMRYGLKRRFCNNDDKAPNLVQERMLQAFQNWIVFQGGNLPRSSARQTRGMGLGVAFALPPGVMTDRCCGALDSLDDAQHMCSGMDGTPMHDGWCNQLLSVLP